MTATVEGKERATLKIDGRDQEVEVVQVAISGAWTSCADSSDWHASRTCALSLGLPVAGESVTPYRGSRSAVAASSCTTSTASRSSRAHRHQAAARRRKLPSNLPPNRSCDGSQGV